MQSNKCFAFNSDVIISKDLDFKEGAQLQLKTISSPETLPKFLAYLPKLVFFHEYKWRKTNFKKNILATTTIPDVFEIAVPV